MEDHDGARLGPPDEVVLECLDDRGVRGLLILQDQDRVVGEVELALEQGFHVTDVGDTARQAIDGLILVDADQQRQLLRLPRWPRSGRSRTAALGCWRRSS